MNATSILNILNAVQVLINFAVNRGISRARVIAILNQAEAEGRDVTTGEVEAELDLLASEIDETKTMIENKRAE